MTVVLLFNQGTPNGSNAEGLLLLESEARAAVLAKSAGEASISIDGIAGSSAIIGSIAEAELEFATEGTSVISESGTPADSRPGLGLGPRRRGQKATFATVERGIEIDPLFFIRRSNADTQLDVDTEAPSSISIESRHAGVLQFLTSGSTELGPVPDDELAIALLMAVA